MARKPRDIVVRFVADVLDFVRDSDRMVDALEDQQRALKDVERVGERSARELEQAYERAGREIREDAKRTGRQTKDAYGDVGKEAGDEFAQNLGESLSSGDVSGLLSGTVGGLVGTFGKGGPIALALGAMGAVGVGVFQLWQQKAQDAATAAQTAFDELLDNATKEQRFRNRLEELFGTYEEGLREVVKMSDRTGTSVADIADALAYGGKPARELAERMREQADAVLDANRYNRIRAGQTQAEVDAARALADYASKSADAAERGRAAEEARARALSDSKKAAGDLYRITGSSYAVGGSTYSSQVPRQARTP
jgi:hypothetical protein